ncbi:MAG: hypothetical protein LBV17_07955 [Treponema sp.]|jgi:hypothetical protein|nr:hypothetical protein [Treponema sp.]
MKNKMIVFGWVIGVLLFLSLLWILSQPLQKYYLFRAINSVLISSGDDRRIMEYKNANEEKTGLFGYWFLISGSSERMFVFAVFQDGILVPLGAVVSADGSVSNIIPLSAHAMQIADKLPTSVLQVYISRISASAANIRGNK